MDFFINGEKINVSLENEKTAGDIFKSFAAICEENSAAVTQIKINGKIISCDDFDEIAKNDLHENDIFEFNIISKEELKNALSKISENFKTLEERMKIIPMDLQCGKIKESLCAIKDLADCIGEFCHIATLSNLFPEITVKKINDIPLNDFFKDFSPILEDFEQALKSNDTVTVGDLSEYEICPRLLDISKSLEELICH